MKSRDLDTPVAWKLAMQDHLREQGVTRYQFVRLCEREGICSAHTAECLLADPGTSTGKREPSFRMALEMARLAGLEVHVKRKRRRV